MKIVQNVSKVISLQIFWIRYPLFTELYFWRIIKFIETKNSSNWNLDLLMIYNILGFKEQILTLRHLCNVVFYIYITIGRCKNKQTQTPTSSKLLNKISQMIKKQPAVAGYWDESASCHVWHKNFFFYTTDRRSILSNPNLNKWYPI